MTIACRNLYTEVDDMVRDGGTGTWLGGPGLAAYVGGLAVGICERLVRPRSQENLYHLMIVLVGGEVQCRVLELSGLGVDIRASRDQQINDVETLVVRRVVERRVTTAGVSEVDIRSLPEQELHDFC